MRISDWSSDVCSSDLNHTATSNGATRELAAAGDKLSVTGARTFRLYRIDVRPAEARFQLAPRAGHPALHRPDRAAADLGSPFIGEPVYRYPDPPPPPLRRQAAAQIGRASCREKVGQFGEYSG